MSSRAARPLPMLARMRRLRHLAAYVLLAWLFGLGSGVVHACVVQGELDHAQQSVSHGAVSHEAHGHEPDHAHPPCEKFCDEPSVMSQSAKSPTGLAIGFWAISARLPALSFPNAPVTSANVSASDIRWRGSIPVSIAFLRLAL